MKRLFSLITLTIQITIALAQQDPQYSLNMFNHLSTNPGYAGSNDAICVTNIDRLQWLGFEGAPRTYVLNGDMTLNKLNSGVGISILSDKIGFENDFQLQGSYAYRVKIGKGKLGIGLSVGMLNKYINGNWISPTTLWDPNTNVYNDPSVPHSVNHVSFDMSFGLFYRTNNLYLGLSSTHLNQAKNKVSANVLPSIKRHYYIAAGYYYQLPNPLYEIRPSVFIKTDAAVFQYDINATLLYNKRVWGGLSYRVGDAIIPMVGFILQNNFKFAVAYDITVSKLHKYTNGSVELMLGYCANLSKGKSKGSYKSVRFL